MTDVFDTQGRNYFFFALTFLLAAFAAAFLIGLGEGLEGFVTAFSGLDFSGGFCFGSFASGAAAGGTVAATAGCFPFFPFGTAFAC